MLPDLALSTSGNSKLANCMVVMLLKCLHCLPTFHSSYNMMFLSKPLRKKIFIYTPNVGEPVTTGQQLKIQTFQCKP